MFDGTTKDGVLLAQECQQSGICSDELKLVTIKTQLDSLHQEMNMHKELILEPWVPEESKKMMMQKILMLMEEITTKRTNLDGFVCAGERVNKVVNNVIDLTTGGKTTES